MLCEVCVFLEVCSVVGIECIVCVALFVCTVEFDLYPNLAWAGVRFG